jgi:nitrate reductase NapA
MTAKKYGIDDGDQVRITTRRGNYEARAQVGGPLSKVLPRRNSVFEGYMFSPWNLSVADSADPVKN